MIFKSVRIKEGFTERKFEFTDGANLIFSKKNSCGKTTLLRFMLYSLGYNIPNTRKINFERCEVGSEIFCDALGDVTLLRYADDFIETTINDEKKTYILPHQLHELHAKLFGTENVDVLDNILGAIYVDQSAKRVEKD